MQKKNKTKNLNFFSFCSQVFLCTGKNTKMKTLYIYKVMATGGAEEFI